MDKTAQKRKGRLNKLLTTNIGDYLGGKATEMRSAEFAEMIQQMNGIDDAIRSIALGEAHGEGLAPEDPVSLTALVKSAKSNANKREYMKATADLGRFHKKISDMVNLMSSFQGNVDKIHQKFLFDDLDDEHKQHLRYFKDRWTKKSSLDNNYFIKDASASAIFNFLSSLVRNKALAGWEKRYPNKVKKLKDDLAALLSLSERLLSITLSSLSDMDNARTVRNPDTYITGAEKIIKAFKMYENGDSGFRKFYETHVKEMLEQQDFFKDQPLPTIPATPPVPEMPVAKPVPAPSIIPNAPPKPVIVNKPPPFEGDVTQETAPPQMPKPTPGKSVEASKLEPSVKKMFVHQSHRQFYNSLIAMSDEAPILLSRHIRKYAKSIFNSDPEVSLKLFKIAQSIEE